MTQIMLGIATITLLFNLVFGIWEGIQEIEEEIGGETYILHVVTEAPRLDGQGYFYQNQEILSDSDLQEIEDIYTVEEISPVDSLWQPLIRINREFFRLQKVSFVGPEYQKIVKLDLTEGSFFTREEYEQRSSVCLISQRAAHAIFPSRSPIGEEIEVYGQWHSGDLPDPQVLTIVGVYESEGPLREQFSTLLGDQLLLPATLKPRMHENHTFHTMALKMRDGSYNETRTAITRQIQDRYGDTFQVRLSSYTGFLEEIQDWSQTFSLILCGFGFLVVIIGSMGILSTMLVGVVERTGQIGIEKAMGAHSSFLFLRFSTEALLLSMGGGILGTLFALLLSKSIAQLGAFLPVEVHGGLYPQAALLGLLVALLFGGVFSIYPALLAVKMEPVEAIGHR